MHLYEEPGDCCIQDTGGIKTVSVWHSFTPGTFAVRFKVVSDPTVVLTYVSEAHPFANTAGNTQTGISVCLDECTSGSMVVAEISYMGNGTTTGHGAIRVVPHPDAQTLDYVGCNQIAEGMTSYPIYVSPSGQFCVLCHEHRDPDSFPGVAEWFNCEALPVESSTWGSIKALYR